MGKVISSMVVAGLLASSANAALLFLQNPDDPNCNTVDLLPGESVHLNIVLTIREIDSGFAFANVFLDDGQNQTDDKLAVVEVIQGFTEPAGDLVYNRSSFTLSADVSHDAGNEYALIMGRFDRVNWGPGTYVLDTLVITNGSDELGEHPITFEPGGRQPQVFQASGAVYVWGVGLDNIIPNFIDPGVGAADDPFLIRNLPPPGPMP